MEKIIEQINYFLPSFGNRPKELIGREEIISHFLEGLELAPGSKERVTLFLGQRGYGKTVILLELAELAKQNGFIIASPTVVSNDMQDIIIEKIQEEGEKLLKSPRSKLVGGNIGFLGFSAGLQFEREEKETKSFRYKLSKLCTAINEYDKGVLILVDEVQANDENLKSLVIAYQELVGEGRNIAIAMAGVPGAISGLLNDHVLTFLNRATKVEIGPLLYGDINAYYNKAFKDMNLNLGDELIAQAAKATEGSPYLMQLIGYYIYKFASNDGKISDEEFFKAIKVSREQYINDICKTIVSGLSDVDIKFLVAMGADEKTSKITEIAKRMAVTPDYAQKYKKRLLDSGVITRVRRGEVEYAVPYLKEYLDNEE